MLVTLDEPTKTIDKKILPITDFLPASKITLTGAKLEAVRHLAQDFHKKFSAGPKVLAVRTFDLISFPYPTKFGFWGAALSPAPYVVMTNRTLFVQFRQGEKIKNLLMNPSDFEASKAVPFYAKQIKRYGTFISENILSKKVANVEEHLKAIGVKPSEIDYISFDHLHVQDLRRLMGTIAKNNQPPRQALFPNAHFIFHRAEVESMKQLHPVQIPWYVPDALKDVCTDKQILIDDDVMLGDGVALLHTPGHTPGNISLAINTPNGVFVTSENGISIDSYCPLESKIHGIRRHAKEWGLEVILNANTAEYTAEQYISMVKEKVVAGMGKKGIPNFFPSSELTASWLAPWLKPTFSCQKVEFGQINSLDI
ncbi:MAG: hypothetical protein IPK14_05030 [Blastocatellia bacterium]|nr:hypothetical protein [Blastocatellia bacterium]